MCSGRYAKHLWCEQTYTLDVVVMAGFCGQLPNKYQDEVLARRIPCLTVCPAGDITRQASLLPVVVSRVRGRAPEADGAMTVVGMESREVMNIREASNYLGVSPDTLYRYIYEDRIPAFKLGNRWKFKKTILDRWMERKMVRVRKARRA